MKMATPIATFRGPVLAKADQARRFNVFNGEAVDVTVFDPHPDTERRTQTLLDNAARVFARLTLPEPGVARFAGSLAEAVQDTDFVQKSAPEREELKRPLLAEIDEHANSDALICSSTSGLLPSRLQSDMRRPERSLAGHPFNPVYLLPLVELCGGAPIARSACGRLLCARRSMAFIADRLLEALWREALWLVNDDVATVEEIDDAIRFGAGLRWAMFGTFLIYRLAGGEDGMRHFMAQFGAGAEVAVDEVDGRAGAR
jgi:carnitine 3-dehydrogenase